jgi:hypothetical protein
VVDVLLPVLPGKEGMQSCRARDSGRIDYLLHCRYMYTQDALSIQIWNVRYIYIDMVIIVIIIQDPDPHALIQSIS